MTYPIMTADGYRDNMIGKTEVMKYAIEMAHYMTDVNAMVLLTGEIGTGKKFYGRYMHNISPRSSAPFLIAHCRPEPYNISEADLFGSEIGGKVRSGIFEQASGGTVLIENLDLLPLEFQSKVLRLLQTKKMYRVGGADLVSVDVRIMASTTRDLRSMANIGLFREDFYYALRNGIILLPPLRDRGFDIIRYARNFLREFNVRYRRRIVFRTDIISANAVLILEEHPWPGNLREMRNAIERAVIIRQQSVAGKHGQEITSASLRFLTDVPIEIDPDADPGPPPLNLSEGEYILEIPDMGIGYDDIVKDLLLKTLKLTSNNKAKTARYLSISVDSLRSKLERYDIEIKNKKIVPNF